MFNFYSKKNKKSITAVIITILVIAMVVPTVLYAIQ